MAMLVLSSGCEKAPVSEGGSYPIGFGVATTKAGDVSMPAGTFSVKGSRSSGSTWDSTTAQDVFATSIQNVTTDGTGACSYTPVQYWRNGNAYRFRAVSPIAPDQVNYSDDLSGNAVITNFTVNASELAQKDLLLSELATAVTGASIGEPAPVNLRFHHLLCKIIIKIGEDISTPNASLDVFTVTGVKLNGLPDRGTYTGTATSGTWNTDGALGLTCVNNTNYALDNGGAYTTVFSGLLLIPMTVTNQVKMVLDYKVSHDGGEATTKSAVISIPPITWTAGNIYTYQLSISEEYFIKFGNITADPWGSTQASGSVIIK